MRTGIQNLFQGARRATGTLGLALALLLGLAGCRTPGPAILKAEVKVAPAAANAPQMMQALQAAREVIARAEGKGEEVRTWPGWNYVEAMRQMLAEIESRRQSGDYAAAYELAVSSKFSMLKGKIISEVLNAIPFMIAGPFGQTGWIGERTAAKYLELKIPDGTQLARAWLGEVNDNDLNNLVKDFKPSLTQDLILSSGQHSRWREVAKTDTLPLDPVAAPYPNWMVVYAYTEVYSPEPRDASIAIKTEFNSPPGTWVAGRLVTSGGTVTGPVVCNLCPYEGKIHCQLVKGWNGILMKFLHRQGARVECELLRRRPGPTPSSDNIYSPMDDLKYRLPGNHKQPATVNSSMEKQPGTQK